MEPKYSITACICTYNRHDSLRNTLQSLSDQTLNRYRILVIDNAPAHSQAAELIDYLNSDVFGESKPDYIAEPATGLSRARNSALTACATDLIAFIDDDAIAAPTWLGSLTEAFESGSTGAVGGKVTPIWETPQPPWLSDKLLSYLSIVDWGPDQKSIAPPQYLAGTNVAYAVELLRSLGGFRTDLGRQGSSLISNEELDMCNILRVSGYDTIYCPKAIVEHTIPAGRLTQPWFRQRLFNQAISDSMMRAPKLSLSGVHAIDRYFEYSPSQERIIDNLFVPQEDPETFYWQCKAIYGLAQLLFKGEISAPG